MPTRTNIARGCIDGTRDIHSLEHVSLTTENSRGAGHLDRDPGPFAVMCSTLMVAYFRAASRTHRHCELQQLRRCQQGIPRNAPAVFTWGMTMLTTENAPILRVSLLVAVLRRKSAACACPAPPRPIRGSLPEPFRSGPRRLDLSRRTPFRVNISRAPSPLLSAINMSARFGDLAAPNRRPEFARDSRAMATIGLSASSRRAGAPLSKTQRLAARARQVRMVSARRDVRPPPGRAGRNYSPGGPVS